MTGFEGVGQAFRDAFLNRFATVANDIKIGDTKAKAICKVLGKTKWMFQFPDNPGLKKGDVITHVATKQKFSVESVRKEQKGDTLIHHDVVAVLIAEKKETLSTPAPAS